MIYLPLILTLLLIEPGIATIAFLRSLSIRGHLLLLSICIFYGIFPLLLTWGGLNLAERFSCTSEAFIFYCPDPSWYGGIIIGMVFTHWLAILTIPSAILGALGLLFSLILKIMRSRTNANISDRPTIFFYRSRHHKVIAGICVAISRRWKLPIQEVRIVTVVLAVIVPGFVLSFYLWC